jgi:hypothetical protein
MAKMAVCVGINDYPGSSNDLKGCINDAKAWAELLEDHFGFEKDSITMLTNAKATKANVLEAVEKMVEAAVSGDIVVFTNSSHGTYLEDTSGDEEAYDEAMCPYDCGENLILDDELREMFSKVKRGVHLTVVSDSCHSGSVTRLIEGKEYRKPRFLSPESIGKSTIENIYRAKSNRKSKHPQSGMKDVLLSGCKSDEYSYDASIGGKYHGAMTSYAIEAIAESGYGLTYGELHKLLLEKIKEAGYPQTPQLEGKKANKGRKVFE